ncbi:MAG: phenylalanine--tRNA ligase subunit alpha, partial [Planctomycetia bacterium]|nr:phenylalanine--tRNA ligase subunit alpha [Planctomycetia bacterium]
MALADFLAQLDDLARQATAAMDAVANPDALEAARIEFLGAKSGRLKSAQKGLGTVDKADKPAAGKRFNEVKGLLETAMAAAVKRLAAGRGISVQAGSFVAFDSHADAVFDPTVPGVRPKLGHVHPITQTIEELSDIMGRLGFTVAEGPEVEDLWHNFDALNIPIEHPARDPLENFYLGTGGGGRGTGEKVASQSAINNQQSTIFNPPSPATLL